MIQNRIRYFSAILIAILLCLAAMPARPQTQLKVNAYKHEASSKALKWANEQLSKTQRLVGVEFRDSLPRSTIGKIMKRELREPYWAGRSARI